MYEATWTWHSCVKSTGYNSSRVENWNLTASVRNAMAHNVRFWENKASHEQFHTSRCGDVMCNTISLRERLARQDAANLFC